MSIQLYIEDMLQSFNIAFFWPGRLEGAENCKDWFLTWPEAPDIWKTCKRYWLCHMLNSHLVLNELLLDPCEAELSVAVIILRKEVMSKSSYMPSCSWPDNHPSTSYQECRRFHWCRCRHNQGWCNCFSPYVRMSPLCRKVRKTLLLKRSDLRITCRLGSCCHQASC